MPLDRDWVRARLLGELDGKRADAMRFAVLTVILTPVFLAVAVALFAGAMYYAGTEWAFERSFAAGSAITLAAMYVAYLCRPKPKWMEAPSDRRDSLLALVPLALLVALTFGTSLQARSPGGFWVLYAGFAMAYLGVLGRAYQARENYYLGWFDGRMNDPFTYEDNIDREHLSLGLALSVPYAILSAYGEIFSSSWMWRALTEEEGGAAADALIASAAGDAAALRRALARVGPTSHVRVGRALATLGFVQPGPAFRLTSDGRKFLTDATT